MHVWKTGAMFAMAAMCLLPGDRLAGQAQEGRIVDFTRSNWFLGYVVKPPEQLLGFGGAMMPSGLRRWGLYADGRVSTDAPSSDETRDLTADDARTLGEFFRDQDEWTTVSAAVVRGMTPELALYLGGGASWRTVYSAFNEGTRLQPDIFWIEDEDRSQVEPNLVGGAFLRIANRIALQFGGQSAPGGFVVGGQFLVF